MREPHVEGRGIYDDPNSCALIGEGGRTRPDRNAVRSKWVIHAPNVLTGRCQRAGRQTNPSCRGPAIGASEQSQRPAGMTARTEPAVP